MCELSEDYQAYAQELLGETPTLLAAKLSHLRDSLKAAVTVPQGSNNKYVNFTPYELSDDNLVRFLRGRKLDVEVAKKTVINWKLFRMEHPDWFNDLSATEFDRFSTFYRIMPEPDSQGRLVCVFPARKCLEILTPEYVHDNPLVVMRSYMWIAERISRDVKAQVCGVVAVLSFKDFSLWEQLRLAKILSVKEILSLIHFLQGCIGLRLKAVYFFDEPKPVHYVWYFVKQLLTEEMKKRFIFFGSDYGKLQELLPTCYCSNGNIEESDYDWVAEQAKLEAQEKYAELTMTEAQNSTPVFQHKTFAFDSPEKSQDSFLVYDQAKSGLDEDAEGSDEIEAEAALDAQISDCVDIQIDYAMTDPVI